MYTTKYINHRFVIDPDRRPSEEHRGRHNLQQNLREVAVLMGEEPGNRAIVVRRHGDFNLQCINDGHRSFDALHFVLLFPSGEDGWSQSLHIVDGRTRTRVSTKEYYAYRLHTREGSRISLFAASRLFQEYVVMAFAKIENQRLQWVKNNQKVIRADLYNNLRDAFYPGDHHAEQVGRRVILPATFPGSPRDFYECYQDAMAIVREMGKPDYFITVTANTKWREVEESLIRGVNDPKDRPDIVAR